MLAATDRIRRSNDFAATIRGGRRAGRGSLVVHLLLDDQPAPAATASAGFVVSKAVGNAVVRNRVRRRLRHLVRPRLASLPAGAKLVVRALPPSASLGSESLASDLDAALAAAQRSSRRRA